jgi:hypothetical protein
MVLPALSAKSGPTKNVVLDATSLPPWCAGCHIFPSFGSNMLDIMVMRTYEGYSFTMTVASLLDIAPRSRSRKRYGRALLRLLEAASKSRDYEPFSSLGKSFV